MIDQEHLLDLTESYLKTLIAEVTSAENNDYDSYAPFGELGIDSFFVLKIVKALENDFGRLPKTLLFENFNIHDLANYFVKKHSHVLQERFAGAEVSAVEAAAAPQAAEPAPQPVVEAPPVAAPVQAAPVAVPSAPVASASPILLLEKDAFEHPELKDTLNTIFETYKNESSVSRGTRNIAPNLFIGTKRAGYFNYSRSNEIILAYAYTGPAEYYREALQEFNEHCVSKGLEFNFFYDEPLNQVGTESFSSTPFGLMQRVKGIQNFTMKGSKMRRLRYQVSKFESAGECRTVEYKCGTHPETDQAIANVIDAWCAARTMVNPLIHMVREEILAGTLHEQHRVFLTYLDDKLQNAILISKMSAEENGYLMDLEFYPKDMPLGGLEYGIVEIIKQLVEEGCDQLSMGGTYGVKLEDEPNADPALDSILGDLREKEIFNDAGNMQFKNKFRPENKSIYLCRSRERSDADNVIDLIMMIADPAKNQTSDEENRTPDFANTAPQAAVATTPALQPQTGNKLTLQGNDNAAVLAAHGYNPLNVPDNKIAFDLKTDSWAQLALPVIGKQMAHLRSQLQQPVNLDTSLKSIFPFQHFVTAPSGRDAENLFCKAFDKKGVVLQTMLFPTWIFSQIEHGFTPVEIPCAGALQTSSNEPYRGNIDIDALKSELAANTGNIAFVCMEVSSNAAAGAPVSIAHLQEVKALLAPQNIPLVLDSTRIVENAQFIKAHEAAYASKDLWVIVKEILSCADVLTVSLAKDFCFNKGGLVATNDTALFKKLEAVAQAEGIGLDTMDKKLLALVLNQPKTIEKQVLRRMEGARKVGQALINVGLPVVQPLNSHCVVIDVKQMADFQNLASPVASFLAWLYQTTGVRAGEHSVGMQKGSAVTGMVRLAIPVGLKPAEIDQLTQRLVSGFSNIVNIPEVALMEAGSMGHIDGKYTLTRFHKPTNDVVEQSSIPVQPTQATQPALAVSAPAPVAAASQSSAPQQPAAEPIAPTPITAAEEPIEVAIVGLSGRYPHAKNMDELWSNLTNSVDSVREIPDDRYNRRRMLPNAPKYRGGFIDDLDKFDSLFFNIAPREAESLDPQERLFLEVSWEALEDAGYYPDALEAEDGSRNIGVYVGAVWSMYKTVGAEERLAGEEAYGSSFLWSIPNRVSYFMNFTGPSIAIDTACSASLTAMHIAAEAIQKGEVPVAIVGGVNLDVHQCKQEITQAGGLLSEDGVCRTFGKGANGYVPGEGVGAMLLKPLKQAKADRDNIYATIKSIAINHGGRTSGYSVPNPKAQGDLVHTALEKAKVDARTIAYIEAHGTGTELGDPIEINGLTSAFDNYSVDKQSCAIGSIKTNIGHLEAAAGIVGVTKVLLQMRNRSLVPSLHSKELNEFIDFESSPFYVSQEVTEWKGKEVEGKTYPLRAGISSFGAGGSNAHVIVEDENILEPTPDEKGLYIVPLSARTEDQLRQMASRLLNFLADNKQRKVKATLTDISFTLQAGRKSFDNRVAFIVKSLRDLSAKLTTYLEQGTAQADAFVLTGNVKNAEGMTKWLSRKEKESFINMLLEGRDPKKLAQLWIEGLLADWQGVVAQARGRRISLPTYPFADKRHWMIERTEVAGPSANGGIVRTKHPMIDSNESTFERQIFKKTFREDEFFIYDHLVSDIPTLPGVAYLDFVRKAGELAAGRKVQKIKNIVWLSPLTVVDGVPNDVYVELKPQGENINFEVFSEKEEGGVQLYAQGKISYATAAELEQEDEYIDIEEIRSRCEKVLDGEVAYPLFKSLGLHLGPSFQVLTEIFEGDDEVLGGLSIPTIPNSTFADYVLHPSLVDGSFQALMGAKLGGKSSGSGEMVVPYSLGEVEVIHPLTEKCFSYVTEAADAKKKKNSNLSKKNVRIVDETGRVLVRVTDSVGVALTAVHEKPKEGRPSGPEEDYETLYYSTFWDETPLADAAKLPVLENDDPVIFFDTDSTLRDAYVARLKKEGRSDKSVMLVQPGDAFSAEGNQFSINPTNLDDYAKFLGEVVDSYNTVGHIVFAWPAMPNAFDNQGLAKGDWAFNEAELNNALDKGIYSFLFLTQTIINKKLETKSNLIYLYLNSPEQPQLYNEAMNGYINIMAAESGRLRCKLLNVIQETPAKNDALLDTIVAEYTAGVDSFTVRYAASGERLTRQTREFEMDGPDNASDDAVALKEGGVYLITGGAGGLGLIFANYLAKECKAKLVLTGRSALTPEREALFDDIKAAGGEVLYVAADVSKRSEVETLIADARERFGRIDGIIHSAGVLRDSYIRNKKIEEIKAVVAPKLFGTQLLDEATQHDDLDFFVNFSSMAALVGNAGQCDYSYSNYYMDSFAHHRELQRAHGLRSGKTLSLNWSLWSDGGMKLDAETELFFRRNLGIHPLNTQTGLVSFAQGLQSSSANFVVIEGVKEKIELAWGLIEEETPEPVVEQAASAEGASAPAAAAAPAAESGGGNELLKIAIEELSKIVQDFLKLDAEDVDIDSILLDLGFDSIGLASFANSVNDIYGTDFTPVTFFEYPNISEIAKVLATDYEEEMKAVHGGGGASSAAPAAAAAPAAQAQTSQAAPAALAENAVSFNKGFSSATLDAPAPMAAGPASSYSPDRRFIERPIAVVGVSGKMPQSDDIEEFWENLRNAEDVMVTEIPKDRWDWEDYYGTGENQTIVKWGGFMRNVDTFDPEFWGISPREAEMMDPQQRIFLETVWGAVEDSGQKVSELTGTRTGVFVGAATRDYMDLMAVLDVEVDEYAAPGCSHAILANRVSFLLGLNGPSAPVDTACSSSLVALHRAVESIHTGSSDMALVGGVQVMLTPTAFISFGAAGLLSPEGKTKTFDKDANGYVRGEGVGAVFLKPLEMAEADGNHIYATIRGTAENHGGRATMLTAPNPVVQAQLIYEAYEKAEIDPTAVSYIECHGTGTSLGDPIEIQAMKKAFGDLYKKHNKGPMNTKHIALSSVKSNIGHLETAAGISGIMKLMMALKYKQIPALLHYQELNPYINLDGTPFYMVGETQEWAHLIDDNGQPIPRIVGISSFGFGGANAHIIFQEYEQPSVVTGVDAGQQLIVLSAKNEERLREYAQSMSNYIEKFSPALDNLAYTLQVGRDEMEERLAIVAKDADDLRSKLADFIAGKVNKKNTFADNTQAGKGRFQALVEGAAGATFLQALIQQHDFSKLAELWVSGVAVDWSLLYPAARPRRISLPTYPFAKRRCWPESRSGAGSAAATSRAAALHPLVHVNTSDLTQLSYTSQFGFGEFFLKDIDFQGHKGIAPAVYLEIARTAVSLGARTSDIPHAVLLREVTFGQPRVYQEYQTITTALVTAEDQKLVVEVFTDEKGEDFINLQAMAEIVTDVDAECVDIESLSATLAECVPGDEVSALYAAAGFSFGSAFNVVNEIQKSDTEALAHLSLPAELEAASADYVVHPSLLNGALQTMQMLWLPKGAYLLPETIAEVRVFAPLEHSMYAWVRVTSEGFVANADLATATVDIDLLKTDGNVCVQLRGVQVARPIFNAEQADEGDAPVVKPVAAADTVFEFTKDADAPANKFSDMSVLEKAQLFTQQAIALQIGGQALDVELDCHMMDTGITSIGMADMSQHIKDVIDDSFSPTVFFEFQTPETIAGYLAETFEETFEIVCITEKVVSGDEPLSVEDVHGIPAKENEVVVPRLASNRKGKSALGWDASVLKAAKKPKAPRIPLQIQDAESELPLGDISGLANAYADELKGVLLTGGTGFLGIHVLHETLVNQPDVDVYCLVRANDVEHGLQRLQAQAEKYELSLPEGKLHVLVGDTNNPQLGLSDDDWALCCNKVQHIIHASAHVNHIEGYATFRDATRGMKEVIRLAGTNTKKLIHFVSSIAACARKIDGRVSLFDRETFVEDGTIVFGGYGQSKWVQETLLDRAQREHGIPYAIYRFGELSGASVSGIGQTDDMLHRLLQMRFAIGVREKITNDVLDMLPIDYAAKVILATAKTPKSWNKIFHATHPKPYGIPYVYKRAEEQGLTFKPVSRSEYHKQIDNYVRYITSLNPVDGFVLEVVMRDLDGKSKNMTMVDSYFAILFPFDQDNFLEVMQANGIKLPDWKTLINRYFERWVGGLNGYMTPIHGYKEWAAEQIESKPVTEEKDEKNTKTTAASKKTSRAKKTSKTEVTDNE